MTAAAECTKIQPLSLPDELILMLLNDQTGYFHQVPGWRLQCAVAGAVLAELSLLSRIDTDMESLVLLDPTETGDPALDPLLKEIADEPDQRNARYWVERFAGQAETVIDLTLDRLVDLEILEHHAGDFWTLTPAHWLAHQRSDAEKSTASQFIRTRISEAIFTDTIPDPRDVIVICLVNTCDVFRFMFELNEHAEERIGLICRMDLIGRSIAEAVEQNITSPTGRPSALSRRIPRVPLHRLLLNPHARTGHLPALFADLAKEYGPVFQIKLPAAKPKTFLAGASVNRWVHKSGRMHLRAGGYFADFENVFGASGVLPSLDGGDHFRLRKAMSPAYSRERLAGQLDQLFRLVRKFMATWTVGETYQARSLCRAMVNEQISSLHVGVDTQDLIDDLVTYKERALSVHIIKVMPEFTLKTPGMKRRAKAIDEMLERVRRVHTPAQRAGCPRNLADDVLGLNVSDPQLVPESNLRFALTATGLTSVYFGDMLSFAIYAMISQPEIHERIRSEADALFEGGDPDGEAFTLAATDVTHRFLQECLRMYPVIAMSVRDVVNSCVVEGHELPVGSRVYIAQTASHYMDDVFPDPFSFDIDRYLPPRSAHRSFGFAPYGLGTHTCLGIRQALLQMTVNMMMIAHYFTISASPSDYELRFNPIPSMKPTKKLKFHIAGQRRELPA